MTPGARCSAAIEILEAWLNDPVARMEYVLAAWGSARRFAGSGDRAGVADLVYRCLRRRRSLLWPYGWEESGRAFILAEAARTGSLSLFSGEGHAPARPTAAEARALAASQPLAQAPAPVRADCPDWLWPEAIRSLGEAAAANFLALQERAPVDLRANTLKASRDQARAALAAEGIETAPLDAAPAALRAPDKAKITAGRAFQSGLVELQDAGSQAIAAAIPPRPGETVLDYCAGGGGKTLALAALMEGRGRLIAHDVDSRRMKDIPERAARAGVEVEIRSSARGLEGRCDHVFVDAPCSGSGSWRRAPEAKWRLTPDRLRQLAALQKDALQKAMICVRPGGRLIYATCSLFQTENQDMFKSWLSEAPEFESLAVGPRASHEGWRLTPCGDGTDGFYVAAARRI